MDNFWPDGIQGAVSLTFDDNTRSQLDNAIPCLDDSGIRGTFYVNPGRKITWEEDISRWQAASLNGHEIGNHTTQHPCSCNFGFRSDGYCLENLSLRNIEETIDAATAELDLLFPEQEGERSFCYPCYQSYVGSGENQKSYVPLVARRFKVGRGGGERPNNPRVVDLSYILSWAVEGHSGEDLIAYVEDAVQQNFWGVICMHGVGGDHISIETESLETLAVYLNENRERIWTDTVINVASYVIDRRGELEFE